MSRAAGKAYKNKTLPEVDKGRIGSDLPQSSRRHSGNSINTDAVEGEEGKRWNQWDVLPLRRQSPAIELSQLSGMFCIYSGVATSRKSSRRLTVVV
ncbi:molecular chaperone DnaJ [Anopheles sinensis]|uniref:Molecular chaperone DnaJ n=1 Tax=Anopheles sinensis TaxID=74873 RepID=A0A084WGJ0_ANOSI|nr:molecular chaperone DnaJ [Anopheles sinensis]